MSAKIIDGKAVNRSLLHACLLVGQAEGILVRNDQKREIIVPQIFVKTIFGRQLKKTTHLSVNSRTKIVVGGGLIVKILENSAKLAENRAVKRISV